MLSAAVAALACLCLAHTSPAEPYNLRSYISNTNNPKDLTNILKSIEEKLRILDTIGAVQMKQARRLDIIQDKLDRVETTLTLKLERAQLAAERLEHKLNMLQTNLQVSIKQSTDTIELNQKKVTELAKNLTIQIAAHEHLLEKANAAYTDTWHRGLLLESLMRDGLSLVNVTRRELADGLRALARRQRDAKLNTADLEASLTKKISDDTNKIELKMQEVLDTHKRFVESCQRVQLDGPSHVEDVLDKLLEVLIKKTAATLNELRNIQVKIRSHDNKVMKLLETGRVTQNDATCQRLESAFRNTSHTILKENELKQLTEKFIALTDRADAALQRLEAQIGDDTDEIVPSSEVTAVADKILHKIEETKKEQDWNESLDWEDDDASDLMDEDKEILNNDSELNKDFNSFTARPTHRRHLHKHPYDRGPY